MGSPEQSTDLLLINCSNLAHCPMYPYAFVQIGALARKRGLRVVSLELTGLAEDEKEQRIRSHLDRGMPRIIGFTVRQLDTQVIAHYLRLETAEAVDPGIPPIFPLEETRRTIRLVRRLTDVPIAVGGFGFSTSPAPIDRYLEADYGVAGDVDGFLDHFELVAEGRNLDSVPNLIHGPLTDRTRNEPRLYQPLHDMEYTDDVVEEMVRFYGRSRLFDTPFSTPHALANARPSIPVEFSRGCPFKCSWCTDPKVKGKLVRYRDPDAVEQDIRLLASHGLRYLWLVCSEFNLGRGDHALAMAERIIRINEEIGDPPIQWRSYILPRWFTGEDLQLLYRSGFAGGWNDFPAWEDEHLKTARVPYKAADIVHHLEQIIRLEKEHGLRPEIFSFFFGNPFITAKGIRTTLKQFYDKGMDQHFRIVFSLLATRIYDCCLEAIPVKNEEVTTLTSRGEVETDLIHPSFHLPRELYRQFGGTEGVYAFFNYLYSSVFPRDHEQILDWCEFLQGNATAEWLCTWLSAPGDEVSENQVLKSLGRNGTRKASRVMNDPSAESLAEFLQPPDRLREQNSAIAEAITMVVYQRNFQPMKKILRHLGLPDHAPGPLTISRYELLKRLYARYRSVDALKLNVRDTFGLGEGAVEVFLLDYLLERDRVKIVPEYAPFLFGSEQNGDGGRGSGGTPLPG